MAMYSVNDFARLFGIHKNTVYTWIRTGKVKFFHNINPDPEGRKIWRVKKQDAADYLRKIENRRK